MTRTGDWMQTFTGGAFWSIDPRPEEVRIEDIAHSLSLQCRFAGHCREFYSVAEHSVRVSLIVPERFALVALLHDAAEAYLVDLPRPVKRASALGDEYQKIEERVHRAVFEAFDLGPTLPEEVHDADDTLLVTEQRDLMARPPIGWKGSAREPLKEKIRPLSPLAAEGSFLARFLSLRG